MYLETGNGAIEAAGRLRSISSWVCLEQVETMADHMASSDCVGLAYGFV